MSASIANRRRAFERVKECFKDYTAHYCFDSPDAVDIFEKVATDMNVLDFIVRYEAYQEETWHGNAPKMSLHGEWTYSMAVSMVLYEPDDYIARLIEDPDDTESVELAEELAELHKQALEDLGY